MSINIRKKLIFFILSLIWSSAFLPNPALADESKVEKKLVKKTPGKKTIASSLVTGDLISIKGGCFEMGDAFGDGDPDERPVHEVCVKDFYLGKHEVTQEKWKKIMGMEPSKFKNCGENCPVENISWDDIQGFFTKLNKITGKNYRLPTEAEWEYASRERGKKIKWSGISNKSDITDYAWYVSNSDSRTHPVGMKKPNAIGLYDMSGNVWEWVSDWDGKAYYRKSPRDNPGGPSRGKYRVMRGGSWNDRPKNIRTTYRSLNKQGGRGYVIGFRLALQASKRK